MKKSTFTTINAIISDVKLVHIGFLTALNPEFKVESEGKIHFEKNSEQSNFYGNSALKVIPNDQTYVFRKNSRTIKIRNTFFIQAEVVFELHNKTRLIPRDRFGQLQLTVTTKEYYRIVSQLRKMEGMVEYF